jgi:group I intron endonuclease
MFTIYQVTNTVNGKRYVGFTSQNPPLNRWTDHKRNAKNGSMTHLHCAIRKYGFESFLWSVLEEGLETEVGQNAREPYWISVINPEYNKTRGGEGRVGFTQGAAEREKRSKTMKIVMLGNKNGRGRKGVKNKEEQNRKHSEFMMGKHHLLRPLKKDEPLCSEKTRDHKSRLPA